MREESIQEAGTALGAMNAEKISTWVKDGSADKEPVTTETPAAADQPRDPATGKFLPKEGESASSATHSPAPEASATATPAASTPTPPPAGASAQEVIDYIEALNGEEPFRIPATVRIPLKRGDQIEHATIDELRKRGMLELDYRHKTAEVARQRRETDAIKTELAAQQARVQAREKYLQERDAEMIEAQKDPEKWEAYQEMQRLYQANPRFRQLMDDALAKRESDAALEVYEQDRYQRDVQQGVSLAAGWIDEFARDPQYAGVNAERVRVRYAQALTAGQARLDPAEVRALYDDEARYLAHTQTPLQQELATLKAEIAELKAAKGAEKHNATTQHALTRAKTPPVAATGRPPAPAAPAPGGKFGPSELAERNQAWAAQR